MGVLWEGSSGPSGKGGALWSPRLPPSDDRAVARELLGDCLPVLQLDRALSVPGLRRPSTICLFSAADAMRKGMGNEGKRNDKKKKTQQ